MIGTWLACRRVGPLWPGMRMCLGGGGVACNKQSIPNAQAQNGSIPLDQYFKALYLPDQASAQLLTRDLRSLASTACRKLQDADQVMRPLPIALKG